MKLHDFYDDEALLELRNQMAAPLPIEFNVVGTFKNITRDELDRLPKGGINGDLINDIKILDDGTLTYKGEQRVLVHIQDVRMHQDSFNLPKFHISYCQALKEQQSENKFHVRYVFTNADDGIFHIRLIKNNLPKPQSTKLQVCKYCLSNINWGGYLDAKTSERRNNMFNLFSLKDFFEKYPKNLITVKPTYSDKTAPLDVYPDDWPERRQKVLKERGLKCQNPTCGRTSTRASDFDVHHINGRPSDCWDSNLMVLCVPCHEKEHEHYQGRKTGFPR